MRSSVGLAVMALGFGGGVDVAGVGGGSVKTGAEGLAIGEGGVGLLGMVTAAENSWESSRARWTVGSSSLGMSTSVSYSLSLGEGSEFSGEDSSGWGFRGRNHSGFMESLGMVEAYRIIARQEGKLDFCYDYRQVVVDSEASGVSRGRQEVTCGGSSPLDGGPEVQRFEVA